jgi:hypothetical protein
MKRRFAIAFVVLACAVPARALAHGDCGGIGFGFRVCANLGLSIAPCAPPCCAPCGPCGGACGPGAGPGAAPWYSYWPYDAYFQTPAPMTYPFWPGPQVPAQPPAPVQQTGYHPPGPSYWYGR